MAPVASEVDFMRALACTVALALSAASPAQAITGTSRTVCVFDPAGTVGPTYSTAEDLQIELQEQLGIPLTLKVYTDDSTATKDLQAGACDSAIIPGVRVRGLGLKSFTVEAMGGLPSYEHLKLTVRLLATESAAPLMRSKDFETAGIFPAGAVYLYVHDRTWTRRDLPGKRVATMDFDPTAQRMVETAGATVVPADISNFAGMFNNNSVDAVYAPATAYSPLELYRGLGERGGLLNFPIAQFTMQFIVRRDRFPDDFGQNARVAATKYYDRLLKIVQKVEAEVEPRYWTDLPAADLRDYETLMRDVRLQLRDDNLYDPAILKLMKRVRCRSDATRAECAVDDE